MNACNARRNKTEALRLAVSAVAVLLFLLPGCGQAGEPDSPDPPGLRVLFIGNSLTYTNDVPAMLRWMLEESQIPVGRIETIAFPNVGLQDHWESGPARARIVEGGWDVVVMQQGPSATEGRPSLLDYGRRFSEIIRDAGAMPAFYMVWPAAVRDFDFDGVSESYRMAADQNDAILYPAGEAWRAVWRRDATVELYGPDGFHPSTLGSYVAALVMFEQLTGGDASSLPAAVPTASGIVDISSALASTLQAAATEANAQYARTALRRR